MIKRLALAIILNLFISNLAFSATNWCTDGDIAGCWKMEDSGSPVLDESSNNNDCTCTGGSCPTTFQATGKYNFGIDWTQANNDSLSCGSDTTVDDVFPINIAVWIAPSSDGANSNAWCAAGAILGKGTSWCFSLDGDGAGNDEFNLIVDWDFSNPRWSTTTDPIVYDDSFQHLAVTYDDSGTTTDAKFYYNGVLQSSDDETPCCTARDSDAAATLVNGIDGSSNGSEFDGTMDELILWGGTSEWSSTDINGIMDNGIDGTQGGVTNVGSGLGFKFQNIRFQNIRFVQ